MKLKDRVESYQLVSDHKLLSKLPIIIHINARGFSKATSLLEKPFDTKLSECFSSTMLRLLSEIEGSVFAYGFSDQIIIVARNDQTNETEPWLGNKLQKICSLSSSIATLHFNDCIKAIDLNVINDPLFVSQVFVVPNIAEAINTIIYSQQQNFHTSIQFTCFYELIKKYDKNTIKDMLGGLSIDEKIDLLGQECGIDFNEYPMSFRRGIAAYRAMKI